ncbi:hypothetical protein TNCT_247351 [Trichonephila clavata]|uniref:Uncharacterized protein n=1 Tax=Trichonephila clavata TaxID=2740835 RepID=A0A8X6IL38_TRICU|nr:hypothetical protein TNCT_247351 [Trichonephila clavata]
MKVLFPCPVPCCQHSNANGNNSFRTTQKRPVESPIQPAKYILNNNTKDKKSKPKKGTAPNVDSQIANPAKKTKQESKIVKHKTSNENILNDNVIPTSNAFADLGLDETDSTDNHVSIEDTLPPPR